MTMLMEKLSRPERATAEDNSSGFSLLEVLIALLVLSIGILGIATLVLQSLGASHRASQSTIAALVALDVNERGWIQVAEEDIDCQDWSELTGLDGNSHPYQDEGYLPGAEIAVTGGPLRDCEVTITWPDRGEDGDGYVFSHEFSLPDLREGGS